MSITFRNETGSLAHNHYYKSINEHEEVAHFVLRKKKSGTNN